MKRDKISKLLGCGEDGQEVIVCGWVRTKRKSKGFSFLVVNDGSCQEVLQVVADESLATYSAVESAGTGAAIKVVGKLKASPAKGQSWEVQALEVVLLGEADATYPLQKKGHSLEFLREIAHLRPRTNTFGAMFRVRNTLSMAVHNFFQSRGFVWAHTPILTAADGEGAGEMFSVTTLDLEGSLPKTDKKQTDFAQDFFGKRAYLCVTGQLEGEFMAQSLGDIYTFGPTFRAENSNTYRHLAEFWMIEPEMAFADLADDMDLAEDFLKCLLRDVVNKCPAELEFFEKMYKNIKVQELDDLANCSFARVSYSEAVEILSKSGKKFEHPVNWGMDFNSEHERFLSEETFKKPVFVYDFPKDIKAFYMRCNDDGKTVAGMDLLVPKIGELIGGSQREERLDLLLKRMEEMKIPMDNLEWYIDLRRYGTAPHAGFGLGFERALLFITGMQNIRDTLPCPRFPGHIEF
ncbi:MAG: asparagine--tRNA ligase [Bdellovibrionota bacterium]